MEQQGSDSDILDALEKAGCDDAVDREMLRLLDSAPEASHGALWIGFEQSLRGALALSEAWSEYERLASVQHDGLRHAETGDPKAGLEAESARRVFWMARLVPALLLGHALRAWREGRKGAAIALLQRASDLIEAARGPNAIRRSASIQARFKAQKRHSETRDLRAEAIAYYLENRASFKSKDDAARHIAEKIVPLKWRTVREYLMRL